MAKRLVSFDPATNAKLKDLSRLYDLPVTWIVRKAVTEWLKIYIDPLLPPPPPAPATEATQPTEA